jgi:hypothetical protein
LSLTTDGVDQAVYTSEWRVTGYPFTQVIAYKPSSIAITKSLTQISNNSSNVNFFALRQSNARMQMFLNSGYVLTGSADFLQVGVWSWLVLSHLTATDHRLYGDGVHYGTLTDNVPFPTCNALVIAAQLAAAGLSDFGAGTFAHSATYMRGWGAVEAAALAAGAHPQSFPGLITYHPLDDTIIDHHGPLNLVTAGAPTFDGDDNPTVDVWPPAGGGLLINGGLIQ